MRKLVLFCLIAALVGTGGWFAYRSYQNRRYVRWDYWSPTIEQSDDHAVTAQGTTMLAKPEKDTNGPLPDFEIIGNPLTVTLTPSIVEGRFVSLRFSALTDYEIIFKPEFYGRLHKVLRDYASLRARILEQKRLRYDQPLDSIPFVDGSGKLQQIRVSLHSSPQRSVMTRGLPQDEGQTTYLQLDLPFPLEHTTNFDHTELDIPDSGVIHLMQILQRLLDEHNIQPTRV